MTHEEIYAGTIKFVYKSHFIEKKKIRRALYLDGFLWQLEGRFNAEILFWDFYAGNARMLFKPYIMTFWDRIYGKSIRTFKRFIYYGIRIWGASK